MAHMTTYTNARANFDELLDRVVDDREIAIIRHRKGEDVAVIAASDLAELRTLIRVRSRGRRAAK
jgi:prevent-host-death family protein